MKNYRKGVYPTMITPYKRDGSVDYDAVKRIVDYYADRGCGGIFAVCQSSEMAFLSLDERIKLAETVVRHSDGRMNIVASGHISDSIDAQIHEINEISKTGIDAFVLVSNRFDLHNDGDDVWIETAQRVLDKINPDIDLGVYECPIPYKRLLSERLIDWCLKTDRFRFIKDTCCDPELLKKRLKMLDGTSLMLFNANAQTTLHSLRHGGAGYSGIMANFHPELYSWLCENFDKEPEKAELLQSILSMYAFTENMHYPITAKYHFQLEGIDMELDSRWKDKKACTEYEKSVVRQGFLLEKETMKMLEAI